MRITNKIIQNNSLYNININKENEDTLNTKMATGKKITRPSEDPVIAIRALRLRSSLADISQYNDKNAEDAESWLDVTEGSLKTIYDQLEDMYEQCNTGVNSYLSTENRNAVVAALKQLRYSVYDAGNADYAGRSVFTGYRTGMTLTFPEQEEKQYTITEARDASYLDEITFIQSKDLTDVNAGNYTSSNLTEQDMSTVTIHRIRLAYNNLDTDVDVSSKGGDQPVTFRYWGTTDWTTMGDDLNEIDTLSLYGDPNPYQAMADYNATHTGTSNKDYAIFVPETGELLLSDHIYANLNETKDNPKTDDKDEGRISITYSKTKWEKGDLRPEHYFYCESDNIKYNEERREERVDVANTR
nr:hypothetical protein [Lachnospiraceae bacterium]